MTKAVSFKYTIPVEKAFVGEDGGMRLIGAATGPEVDLEYQRVHPKLIDKWISQINSGAMEVIYDDWHKKDQDSITADLGRVEKAHKDEKGHMWVTILLDEDNPVSQYIHKAARKGKQYGMSIAGDATDWVDEVIDGHRVRTITDGILERIAHTTRPIWTPSFGTVISKAIDAAQSGSANGETQVAEETTVSTQPVENTTETTEVTETTTATTDSGAATNPDSGKAPEESGANTETPVEKAVSADTKRDQKKLDKIVKLVGQLNGALAEIGLSGVEVETSTNDEPEKVAKAGTVEDESEKADVAELTKIVKAQSEQIAALMDRVSDGSAPGALKKSTPVDPLAELKAIDNPIERLRLGLAVQHGEDK
jgi:hypothetical protein